MQSLLSYFSSKLQFYSQFHSLCVGVKWPLNKLVSSPRTRYYHLMKLIFGNNNPNTSSAVKETYKNKCEEDPDFDCMTVQSQLFYQTRYLAELWSRLGLHWYWFEFCLSQYKNNVNASHNPVAVTWLNTIKYILTQDMDSHQSQLWLPENMTELFEDFIQRIK